MPDYLQGKIYTIRCKSDNSLIYVGSTTQSLSMRMAGHRKEIYNENRKHYTKKLYQIIREMDNLNEWYIELYENFPCNNKEELLKKEGEIIKELGTLNYISSGLINENDYNDLKNKVENERNDYKNKKLSDVQQYEKHLLKKEYLKRYNLKKKLEKEQII